MKRNPLEIASVPLQGVHLIEASAGTGKTFTITSLIVRLVVEAELGIERIVAVTFTNAATAELKDRVQRRISEARRAVASEDAGDDPLLRHLLTLPDRELVRARLEVAERNVDRASIFTIHGFAQRMLADHAFESGVREDLELTGDDRALIYDVVTDFWSSEIAGLSPELFRALGGAQLFGRLAQVATVVAGAHEVPLFAAPGGSAGSGGSTGSGGSAGSTNAPEVGGDEPSEWQRLCPVVQALLEQVADQFAREGEQLLLLLRERLHTLPGNIYKPEILDSDHLSLARFLFQRSVAEPCPAKSLNRWTSSYIQQKTKKAFRGQELSHSLLDALGELQEKLEQLQALVPFEEDRLRMRLAAQVTQRLAAERQRAGIQSFDGLLIDLCASLRDPTSGARLAAVLRRKYPVALIDEFQDTDAVQYEIFRRVYQSSPASRSHSALYLIGDPKQSIYAFRGADVHTYLAAARAADAVWTLATSYRSSPQLVAALNTVFSGPERPFDLEDIRYESVAARPGASSEFLAADGHPASGVSLLWTDRPQGEWLEVTADAVAHLIQGGARLGERRVGPGQVAVLTRTNREAQEVQQLLLERGIPAVLHGDRSVFESDEALELRRVLLALDQPGQRRLVRTALATRMIGLTAQDLADLEADVSLLEAWSERLRRWGTTLRQHGVARALHELWAAVELTGRTLAELDGERRLTNFRHLLELLHEAQTREHLGVPGLLRFLETAISAPTGHANAAEAMQLRLESDADAVTLTTAHKSKGLEYDVVFLPRVGTKESGLRGGPYRFHEPETHASWLEVRCPATRVQTEETAQRELYQEALRLGYVALTRAKHHVVALTGPDSKGFSALGYFLHAAGAPPSGGEPPGPAELGRHLAGMPAELRRAELERLCEASRGALELMPAPVAPPAVRAVRDATVELSFPGEVPAVVETERTSSFSAMTRERAGSGLSRAAREGHDFDEAAVPVESTLVPSGLVPSGLVQSVLVEAAELVEAARLDHEGLADICALADFPKGAAAGDALHAALEHAPFAGSPEERRLVVEAELGRRGFSPAQQEQFADALEAIIRTPFGPDGFCLMDASQRSQVAEMEFSLPVGEVASGGRRFSPARLARALSGSGAPDWLPPDYLDRVASLGFAAFSGFLRGFIDFVFEHQGKLYVVDYKSNYLGDHYGDYRGEALLRSMQEHHYLLQGLLYAVAIDRYGASRRPDYDFEQHFGGVYYLFLRGMRPGDPQSGVFGYRPSLELMQRLDRALRAEQEVD